MFQILGNIYSFGERNLVSTNTETNIAARHGIGDQKLEIVQSVQFLGSRQRILKVRRAARTSFLLLTKSTIKALISRAINQEIVLSIDGLNKIALGLTHNFVSILNNTLQLSLYFIY